MYVPKYRLFVILLVGVVFLATIPGLYKLAAYQRAPGMVTRLIDQPVPNKKDNQPRRFAEIEFSVNNKGISFLTSYFIGYLFKTGEHTTVLFNPSHPVEACVYSVMGIFGNVLIFLFPFSIILTAVFFIPRVLPRYLYINFWKKREME